MSGEGLSQRGAEFQLQPVPASKRKRSTANNEKPRIWPVPIQQMSKPVVPSNGPVRLRRSQSVPNMKAKYSLDLSIKAHHSIAIPPKLSQSWNPSRGWHITSKQQLRSNHVGLSANGIHSTTPSNIAGPSRLPDRLNVPKGACTTMTSPALSSNHSPTVFTPSILPPINSQTLKELDLHEILKNPQLRHDLVFDADLQFRPNFDGERGRRKRDVCNKYWRAVQREIQSRCACTSFYGVLELPCVCASNRRRGSGQGPLQQISDPRFFARIPNLIAELRCICLSILPSTTGRSFLNDSIASAPAIANGNSFASLQKEALLQHRKGVKNEQSPQTAQPQQNSTPNSAAANVNNLNYIASPITNGSDEHAIIVQCLDPSMIMQQLYHGGLDIAGLITTVGSILKQNCAPMRDTLIDNMIETVTQHGDVTRSLRQCFEILELMKLDVANHQLSTSRIYLVDTAAEFESRWFRDQVCRGKVSVQRTVSWFNNAMLQYAEDDDSTLTKTARISKAFDGGVLDLIFDPPNNSSPRSAFGGGLSSPSRLSSLSSIGSQTAASMMYPETFQFDAYRLLTFHGEVTDITVVSMLLLLYRQLACSPQSLASSKLPFDEGVKPSPSTLSALAVAQQDNIKGEIWTLLREAEVERSNQDRTTNSSANPMPPTPGGVASRVLDSRLTSWRKVVGDIVLQIAARAIRIQVEAYKQQKQQKQRQGGVPVEDEKMDIKPEDLAPSQATIALLTRWLETNLHSASPLFKLCRSRVRALLTKLTITPEVGTSAFSPFESPRSPLKSSRKRNAIDQILPLAKRVRLCPPPISPKEQQMMNSIPDAGDLEPFSAEMGLLAERINKVKAFHLQVYRTHYEHMAASHHQRKVQKQQVHQEKQAKKCQTTVVHSTSSSQQQQQHPIVFVDPSVPAEQEQQVQQTSQEQEQQKA